MTTFEIDTNDFVTLLSQSQRRATIAGNTGPQVYGLKLSSKEGGLRSIWIVKDGISSLSWFSHPVSNDVWEEGDVYLPDIDRVLGILRFHGGNLKVETVNEDGVRFTSNNKQTTIQSSPRALAFPNGRDSLMGWAEKSEELASRIQDGKYRTSNGDLLDPMLVLKVDGVDMYEAFRCAGINGQDPDLFVFDYSVARKRDEIRIRVGQDLKGATVSRVEAEPLTNTAGIGGFDVAYNGGFDNLFKHINGPVNLSFFDFRSANQGIALLISWGIHRNWVLQASFEKGK